MNLQPIKITKINETYIKVTCPEIFQELDISDRFSFDVNNSFDPRKKKGQWDGIIKLYNRKTKRLYTGLLYELLNLISEKNWPFDLDPALLPNNDSLTQEDITNIIDELIKPHDNGVPINLYDYQLNDVEYIMNMNRTVSLAATSAGKSLIIYIAVRLYQYMEELNDKTIFIVVPTVSLVEQLYNDFDNYATFPGSNWHVGQYCQKVTAKYPKDINKQIVILTWHSMQKMDPMFYEDMGCVFVDECHTAKAQVLKGMLELATKVSYRHGLTGTLDDFEANELTIQGLLGPAKRIVTAKQLIDDGRATKVKIKMLILKHPDLVRKALYDSLQQKSTSTKYHREVTFLNTLERRIELLLDMIEIMPGNSIILFDRVEEYGKVLHERFKARHPDRTFLIVGSVKADERENIRLSMNDHDNAVIFANFQCMSTGVSIKKLHNAMFVSSSKGKIRVLQSLGRLMRLHDTKEYATLYDVVDNLSYKNIDNYVLEHAKVRLENYIKEQHDIEFVEIDIDNSNNKLF